MDKVKLSIEVDSELLRQVKLAATSKGQSVQQWIVNAILRELDGKHDGWVMPPKGAKPRGSQNPPTPRSGRSVADAVLEDRR